MFSQIKALWDKNNCAKVVFLCLKTVCTVYYKFETGNSDPSLVNDLEIAVDMKMNYLENTIMRNTDV